MTRCNGKACFRRCCCCKTGWCCPTKCCQGKCCQGSCFSRWLCCPIRKCCGGLKRCFRRQYRFILDICILYILTFVIVVPLLSLNLRHTGFDFLKHKNVSTENKRMFKENAARYNESLRLLKKLNENLYKNVYKVKRNVLQQTHQNATTRTSLFHDTGASGVKAGLAITIITVSRWVEEQKQPHYLIQIVATFLRLMQENQELLQKYAIHFSVCNVDPKPTYFDDALSLPDWIPVYTRYQNVSKKVKQTYKPVLNKEKDDYTYCLDKGLERNLSHVLLVEDDALPRDELFVVLDSLILSTYDPLKNPDDHVVYYKLYHPERLLGYISLEIERIPELLSSSVLLSTVLLLIYTKWRKNISTPPLIVMWFSFFIYSCLFFLAIGRVNVLEFRRISHHFYQMTPSPGCCTPAMLFTRNGGQKISAYLKTVIDRAKFPKDLAIDEYVRKHRFVTRFVQPNLFKHIGHVSSLRPRLLDPYIV